MTVNELSRFDTVKATVCTRSKNNGYYLKINGLEETPIVLVYDCTLLYGQEVIVSIMKMSENRNYILTRVDSVCESYRVYENDYLMSA